MNELDKCDPTKINILGINFLKWINICLKNYLLGFRDKDRGHALENESVREREVKPLQKIQNNYKKIVIFLDNAIDDEFDGIESIDGIKWLLK